MEESNEIQIKEIIFNSTEYKSELELRDEVLRRPLGMSLYDENLDAERNDIHIGAFSTGKLVGVLILTQINEDLLKMRQFAVAENMRLLKIGTQLVHYAEKYATLHGFTTIILNARESAMPFYQKLDYNIVSDIFLEINIPHYKMSKSLKND